MGKDTVCQIIQKLLHPRRVKRFAFADTLKWEVARACGVTPEHIEQNKELFRPILQWWGTEFRRGQDQLYWVKRINSAISGYLQCLPAHVAEELVVVVTDVRFRDEAAFISGQGGTLIRIHRPNQGTIPVSTDLHASETDMESAGVDHELANDSTLEQLEQDVAYVLAEMGLLESEVAK